MMAAILNSAMLDSDPSHLGFRHLVIFSQIHSKPLLLHSDFDSNIFNLTQTHSFSFNLMMAAILIFDNLNFTILDSAILVFPLKLTHTCQYWFPPFAQKKLHSFILTQLDDCSYLEICHLWFTHFAQKKPSLIHSDSTSWWQPSWILPICIPPS